MILGRLSGKTTTRAVKFITEARVRKRDYVSIKDTEGRWVLGFIDSLERFGEKTVATVSIYGYRDKRGILKTPNIPIADETPVYSAEDWFIKEVLGIPEEGFYMGILDGYEIKVRLNPGHLIRKHIGILAKTGAGKSYVTGVLLEELLESGIPAVVLDPHGEYFTLRKENTKKSELKYIKNFDVDPKSYKDSVKMFSLRGANPIRLNGKLSANDLFQLLPTKISSNQKGIIYSAIKNLEGQDYTLRDIIDEVAASKTQTRWGLIPLLESLWDTKLFSANPTTPKELVKEGKISVVDLKDAKPEVQSMVVMKLIEDLFHERKRGNIPEFLLVVEEAHNFCPERGFGEVASSKIIRTVASEGRKFGLGLVIVSQRPAKVDKNVLSQCNTQIILKVTNPNDLKAIVESVEGITQGLKNEIKDLPIGVALIVGATENPMVVDVRIRRTEHGGESLKIEEKEEISGEKTLVFKPMITSEDVKKEFGIMESSFVYYPLWKVNGKYKEDACDLYVDGITGEILFNSERGVERSSGVRALLDIQPSSRLIILYLMVNKIATIEKLSDMLRMPLNTVKSNIKDLLEAGYLETDGYMIQNKMKITMPQNISDIEMKMKPESGSIESALEFMVSKEFAGKIADMIGFEVKAVDPVFYPYWVGEKNSKKVAVDARRKSIDEVTSGIIEKFL